MINIDHILKENASKLRSIEASHDAIQWTFVDLLGDMINRGIIKTSLTRWDDPIAFTIEYTLPGDKTTLCFRSYTFKYLIKKETTKSPTDAYDRAMVGI